MKTISFKGRYLDVIRNFHEWQIYNQNKYVIIETFSTMNSQNFHMSVKYCKKKISEIIPDKNLIKNLSLNKNLILN
jgi:hypothetical protein